MSALSYRSSDGKSDALPTTPRSTHVILTIYSFPSPPAACHYTISDKPQVFSSPNYHNESYPNSQVCTWRFLVEKKTPQNEQILIKFLEFDLQKGKDGDVVRIYSGWDDDKATLLAEFNGDNPPPAEGVASGTPVVYMVFSSDSRGRSQGFRGLFVNQGTYCFCFLVFSGTSYYMTQKISPLSVTLVPSCDFPRSSVSSASMTRSSTTQA